MLVKQKTTDRWSHDVGPPWRTTPSDKHRIDHIHISIITAINFPSSLLPANSLCVALHIRPSPPFFIPSQLQWLSQQESLPYILKGAVTFHPTYTEIINKSSSQAAQGNIIFVQFDLPTTNLDNKKYELYVVAPEINVPKPQRVKVDLHSVSPLINLYFPVNNFLIKYICIVRQENIKPGKKEINICYWLFGLCLYYYCLFLSTELFIYTVAHF